MHTPMNQIMVKYVFRLFNVNSGRCGIYKGNIDKKNSINKIIHDKVAVAAYGVPGTATKDMIADRNSLYVNNGFDADLLEVADRSYAHTVANEYIRKYNSINGGYNTGLYRAGTNNKRNRSQQYEQLEIEEVYPEQDDSSVNELAAHLIMKLVESSNSKLQIVVNGKPITSKNISISNDHSCIFINV